jgi:hypothetical protein
VYGVDGDKENSLHERVAIVETGLNTLTEEVNGRIRPTLGRLGELLQNHESRLGVGEKEQDTMRTRVMPEVYRTLEQVATTIQQIRIDLTSSGTDQSWVKRNLAFVLQGAMTLILAWVAIQLKLR